MGRFVAVFMPLLPFLISSTPAMYAATGFIGRAFISHGRPKRSASRRHFRAWLIAIFGAVPYLLMKRAVITLSFLNDFTLLLTFHCLGFIIATTTILWGFSRHCRLMIFIFQLPPCVPRDNIYLRAFADRLSYIG